MGDICCNSEINSTTVILILKHADHTRVNRVVRGPESLILAPAGGERRGNDALSAKPVYQSFRLARIPLYSGTKDGAPNRLTS